MDYLHTIYQQFLSIDNPIINLLMVMVIIWTAGVIFRIIHQPPVLGELLAGFIFGPPLLGIIKPDETLHVLSDLGIFFLMFYAGLETNPFELKRMTRCFGLLAEMAGLPYHPGGIYGRTIRS